MFVGSGFKHSICSFIHQTNAKHAFAKHKRIKKKKRFMTKIKKKKSLFQSNLYSEMQEAQGFFSKVLKRGSI